MVRFITNVSQADRKGERALESALSYHESTRYNDENIAGMHVRRHGSTANDTESEMMHKSTCVGSPTRVWEAHRTKQVKAGEARRGGGEGEEDGCVLTVFHLPETRWGQTARG